MIYFLRHGQTAWNAAGKCQGRADIALNEHGVAQAKQMADTIKKLPIDCYFCSPLLRAQQTFTYAVGRPPLASEIEPRIAERDFGEYEGLTRDQFDFKGFWDQNQPQQFQKAESINDMINRAKSFLHDLNQHHRHDYVLVVSHGGFGVVLTALINGKPRNGDYLQIEIPHGSLLELDNTKYVD